MRTFIISLFSLFLFSCNSDESFDENLLLRYDKLASSWEETLPLGNGRLGMMPDGGIEREKIVLNDISMWSGREEDAFDDEAVHHLPKIRKLLLSGKNFEAQELMYKHFKCKGKGSNFGQGKNAPYGCFQLLGNLHIEYNYTDTVSVENFERILDISNAVAYTKFSQNGTNFKREYFASQNNDVMLIHISADKKEAINLSLNLSRPEQAEFFTKNGDLYMQGQLSDGFQGKKGVRFLTRLHLINIGGTQSIADKKLRVKKADEVLIIISSATDFLYPNYKEVVDSLIEKATTQTFKQLKKAHTKAYKEKFNRVTLHLGKKNDTVSKLSTPERLQRFQEKPDPALAALYFQYGRYLMISGTREKNTLPLNLQGLWANTTQTPWNGDYHLNINVQMNYWQAEVCNLSELHKPLLDFTKSLVNSGEKTAKSFYGAEGWVAHVISNPWHFTAPGEHASWGATNTGGAWLCSHLWEHYAFTQDTAYLKDVFPTMKKSAQFFLSTMIKEPKFGWLVTAPSSSPENAFYLGNDKRPIYVCMAPTVDAQIIRELFQNTLQAAEILGKDDTIIKEIKEKQPLLPPTQISLKGYIQEWLEDYDEVDVHHRHVSHLYGLYPANQISPDKAPKLAKAAEITLNRRGDEGTGWSRAWKINFWARLYDGNHAYKLLKNLLKPAFTTDYNYHKKGGTYPNLFCAHPPFQIDGNFGGTAGIAEMLIQSHEGYINLLPALPDHWGNGNFEGLRVRGGAIVDATWENSKLQKVTLHATTNNTFKVKIPRSVKLVAIDDKKVGNNEDFVTLTIKKGEKISLVFN